MEEYSPEEIERKWQKKWKENDVFSAEDVVDDKIYVLGMFPYPSGKLHMGHVRNYTLTDTYSRFKRMQGLDVLHPMGWDAFGLPAENAALERDISPREWTYNCIEDMKTQMESMGFGYDWSREITTCDSRYYRWNQWFFREFYNEGIVEYKEGEVNWCPSCETVLANEQVEDGKCWRCDSIVKDRNLDQWYFKITEYADDLLEGLEGLDWPSSVKEMQKNWIGKQEGATVKFEIEEYGDIEVFTTRLDTIFGATFVALAPEHPITEEIAENNNEVEEFIEDISRERKAPREDKKGVFTGLYAINPANNDRIPVYIADFVVEEVGTGAIMAVPAHDQRDHDFAKKHNIEIKQVIEPKENPDSIDIQDEAYTEDGVLINSEEYSGLDSDAARDVLVDDLDGEKTPQYRLRDWLISRQRYWGTPIPIVHCESCGPVLVPEQDLPVELPEYVVSEGNSLEEVQEWIHTECPSCGGQAKRETDTMDTFVDSSWYFLRYISPKLESKPFEEKNWMPVDIYVGGIEHAVMHLLYARFFTRVLENIGLLEIKEPFQELLTQGMVLLEGEKMSKSKGNIVSPQRIVDEYGADTARLFMMSAALPQRDFDWKEKGVKSNHTFLQRLWNITKQDIEYGEKTQVETYIDKKLNATIERTTQNYEDFRFNDAVREIKDLVSTLEAYIEYKNPEKAKLKQTLTSIVRLLYPIAPHICEELWNELDKSGMVANADWPTYRPPENYETEEELIDQTRQDIREIIEVADIKDIEKIELIISPKWKYKAFEIAKNTEKDDIIGEIMSKQEMQKHGDQAVEYAQQLQQNRHSLHNKLTQKQEKQALENAKWLFEREFNGEITVKTPENTNTKKAKKAKPLKPAIEVH